jgi:hypothetical protein
MLLLFIYKSMYVSSSVCNVQRRRDGRKKENGRDEFEVLFLERVGRERLMREHS